MNITHTFAHAVMTLMSSPNTWAETPRNSNLAYERSVDDKSLTHLLRTNEATRIKVDAESS